MARPKRPGQRRRAEIAVLTGDTLLCVLFGQGFFERPDAGLLEDLRDQHGAWVADALAAAGIGDYSGWDWGVYEVAAKEARRRGVSDLADCF